MLPTSSVLKTDTEGFYKNVDKSLTKPHGVIAHKKISK